jgi:hypothetical protein
MNQSTSNNISVFSALAYYPYNDVKNTSTNSILASNIDNYSITLTSGQQIEVTNLRTGGTCFNSAINLSIPYTSGGITCVNATKTIILNFTKHYGVI